MEIKKQFKKTKTMETIYLIMAIIGVFLLIKAIVINGKDSDKSAMYAIIGNTLCIPNIIIFSKTSIIISVVGLIAFIAGVIINASKLYASAKDKETYIEIK